MRLLDGLAARKAPTDGLNKHARVVSSTGPPM
jgi:hypothetical protein